MNAKAFVFLVFISGATYVPSSEWMGVGRRESQILICLDLLGGGEPHTVRYPWRVLGMYLWSGGPGALGG